MRLIQDDEVNEFLLDTNFCLRVRENGYGNYLSTKKRQPNILRCGARPVVDFSQVPALVRDLNGCLANLSPRLLYVSRIEEIFPSTVFPFRVIQRAFIKNNSAFIVRGHLFSVLDYHISDQLSVSDELYEEMGLLIAILGLILMGGWDAFLLSPKGEEWIEFWEGNILFYSSSASNISEVQRIFRAYDCPMEII